MKEKGIEEIKKIPSHPPYNICENNLKNPRCRAKKQLSIGHMDDKLDICNEN